jgi:hypothetical protein
MAQLTCTGSDLLLHCCPSMLTAADLWQTAKGHMYQGATASGLEPDVEHVVSMLLTRRLPWRLALQPVDVDPDAADALLEAQQGDAADGDVKDVQARASSASPCAVVLQLGGQTAGLCQQQGCKQTQMLLFTFALEQRVSAMLPG